VVDGQARLVRAALVDAGAGKPAAAFWVPGRIEVLGKHTDYAGGRSLVCAVEQGFVVAAAPRRDSGVRVFDVARGREARLSLDEQLGQPAESWARYPWTVLRRLSRNFPDARQGADIAFLSNLPLASGMSSSSAFMVAMFLAIAEINDLWSADSFVREVHGAEALSGYLATVENGQSFGALTGDRGVGTFGGSEDHTAMLCCRADQLSVYAFCPVRHERQIEWPARHRFVVAMSGVMAEKTGGARDAYNRASLAVRAVLDVWRSASGRQDASLADAVRVAGAEAVRDVLRRTSVDGFSTDALVDRLDQFVAESEQIIPAATEALDAGDLDRFGALVDRSQDLAERALRNQVPETIALARSARELGAVAASAFGAGFGGSVWALVAEGLVADFARRWESGHRAAFPESSARAAFLTTRPGPAAMPLSH
jgi:galactokinase